MAKSFSAAASAGMYDAVLSEGSLMILNVI
jgi:hypothetical protein